MRRFIFADEAGDFDFSRKQNVSRYFIVCAIRLNSCEIGHEMLRLRRDLLWDGIPIPDYFHATKDTSFVREKVFSLIENQDFDIYAQVLEKSKAIEKVRASKHVFYKYAWFYLLKNTMPRIIEKHEDQLMATIASIGVRKGQQDYSDAVQDVLAQTQRIDAGSWRTTFCSCASDPCLQVADYCTWALQRKWERGDSTWYDRIKSKIRYEYDMWAGSNSHFY